VHLDSIRLDGDEAVKLSVFYSMFMQLSWPLTSVRWTCCLICVDVINFRELVWDRGVLLFVKVFPKENDLLVGHSAPFNWRGGRA
jgi:hypothetical protein